MTFSPILKIKIPIFKKIIFFFEDWVYTESTHTQAMYMVTFSFNLMAIVCVILIANLLFFLLTKNDIIVHYKKFPNLGFTMLLFQISKALGPFPKLSNP